MDLFFILEMLAGLALFLYGMSMLGDGLEKLSGGRLEKTLEKLSDNTLKAVLLGAFVTAAVQSSSATTVIVVGLVNANIIRLKQAVGVIMGANIGTTVTAHILRLSSITSDNIFLTALKPSSWTPVVLIIGVILIMRYKNGTKNDIGKILLGFGILFTGMAAMTDAVSPMADSPIFSQAFETLQNPIAGVLAGALVTAVIQSSSASVGILQALTVTGSITYSAAFPIIMGQNIGTTITPILASIGATKNAKRSAFVHLTFNIIGTLIFLIGTYAYQYIVGWSFWDSAIDSTGIAYFHTIFNVTVTLMLIPFAGYLESLAMRCIKDDDEPEVKQISAIAQLEPRFLATPGLALEHVRMSIFDMGLLAEENYKLSVTLLKNYDEKVAQKINETEDVIDEIDAKVSQYLLRLSTNELSDYDSRQITSMLRVCSSVERIGDYSTNIMECAERMHNDGAKFSTNALFELDTITSAVAEIIEHAFNAFVRKEIKEARRVEPLEEIIDLMEETLKERHMERLRAGVCTVETGYTFMDCVANIERIADHCSDIAVEVISQNSKEALDKYAYKRRIHQGLTEHYAENYDMYTHKYMDAINNSKAVSK